ncbi:MAG: type II and III secretion system protein [Pseudomonadota bacterium]
MSVRLSMLVITSGLLLASCINQQTRVAETDRDAILKAYEQRSGASRALNAWRNANAIDRLEVSDSLSNGGLVLSVDVKDASLDQVIAQILADPRVQFLTTQSRFPGRVSAQFERLPLLDGLNLLLGRSGLLAQDSDGLIRIESTGSFPPETSAEDTNGPYMRRSYRLSHLAALDAATLVSELFANNEFEEGVQPFAASAVVDSNMVYLSGLAKDVDAAINVLVSADRPVAHVIIEAMVVDLDITAIEEVGMSLSGGTTGSYGALSLTPSSIGSNVVATFEELAMNTEQLTATIDLLASLNTVDIVSRPYLATRSTQPATIEIVDDQFVRVDTSTDGSGIVSTDSVSAGITMQITPTVMAGDSIRMDVMLEESKFAATFGDIVITKERNTASTSMSVQSGQTIVIGGLNSRYRSTANSGIPWLRHVPVLNFLTASRSSVGQETEMVVYLTPYIWTPGMGTPLPRPNTPEVPQDRLTHGERFWSSQSD